MSSLAIPSGLAARHVRRPALLTLFNRILQLVDAIREGLELATRYKVLAYLNDQELASIGLKREDIPRVVVSGFRH